MTTRHPNSLTRVNTWVALLRGVNVGGRTIEMAELRRCLTEAGFGEVRTVLASGNAVFTDPGSTGTTATRRLKGQVETALRDRFGYDAWVVLVDVRHVRDVIDDFPFVTDDPAIHPYVVFGSEQAALDELLAAAPDLDLAAEEIAAGRGVVYWRCPKGRTLETPFAKLLAKPRFRTSTTSRNLRTLQKILSVA